MENIAIFGAGDYGTSAFFIFGKERVSCFIDHYKTGQMFGKPIMTLDQFLENGDNSQIVIASRDYRNEMISLLIDKGIHHYNIFEDSDYNMIPKAFIHKKVRTFFYKDLISLYHLKKYERIAIVGCNRLLHTLMNEMKDSGIQDKVKYFVSDFTMNEYPHYDGIEIKRLQEIENEIDCLIIQSNKESTSIHDYFFDYPPSYFVADFYDIDKFVPEFHHPELEKFKEIHKGQRCFIIGNGPSLRPQDLETLHHNGEICFASNLIYKIFSQTNWRPTYYGLSDVYLIENHFKEIENLKCENKILVDYYMKRDLPLMKHAYYVHQNTEHFKPNFPRFSDDITVHVFNGDTVTYDCWLQFAAYMGFSEIYLLGVDNTTVGHVTDPVNHFVKDYYNEKDMLSFHTYKEDAILNLLAYQKAEKVSRKQGFRIYNATRGGALEIFERVNFDTLFQ